MTPDPAWLDEHEAPPKALLRERCDGWLLANGIEVQNEIDEIVAPIPVLDEVRKANQIFLDGAIPRLAALSTAWHHKEGLVDSSDLSSPTATRERLMNSGCLDFQVLSDTSLVPWLIRLSLWPERMPRTINPLDCGVSSTTSSPIPRQTDTLPCPRWPAGS